MIVMFFWGNWIIMINQLRDIGNIYEEILAALWQKPSALYHGMGFHWGSSRSYSPPSINVHSSISFYIPHQTVDCIIVFLYPLPVLHFTTRIPDASHLHLRNPVNYIRQNLTPGIFIFQTNRVEKTKNMPSLSDKQ